MFWEILSSVVTLAVMLFGRKTVPYFQSQADANKAIVRKQKAELATTIVRGVVGLFKVSKGITEVNAAQLHLLIDQAFTALVGQGFTTQKARGIAEREVAQVLSVG